jgi:hypothetical protein
LIINPRSFACPFASCKASKGVLQKLRGSNFNFSKKKEKKQIKNKELKSGSKTYPVGISKTLKKV